MMEMVVMYGWTLLAVGIAAGALALMGSQVAARNGAVASLVISQSSALGVAVALYSQEALKRWGFYEAPQGGSPYVTYAVGFVLMLVVHGLCSKVLAGKRQAAQGSFYIGVFALLLALTYMITALTPTLESHVLAAFFGDPAFVAPSEAQVLAVFAFVVLVFTWLRWRAISAWSFQLATFGIAPIDPRLGRTQRVFNILYLLLLFASVVLMGLLFTLSCLLLPTMLTAYVFRTNAGFRRAIVPAAIVGATGGFLFSLWEGSLPTSPCMTLGVVLCSLIASLGGLFPHRP